MNKYGEWKRGLGELGVRDGGEGLRGAFGDEARVVALKHVVTIAVRLLKVRLQIALATRGRKRREN